MNSVGLETLGLRMERLCSNSYKLAKLFEDETPLEVKLFPV